MIVKNGKKIAAFLYGVKLGAIYKGGVKIWEGDDGSWQSDKPWQSEKIWLKSKKIK